jgi:hypothetical protein
MTEAQLIALAVVLKAFIYASENREKIIKNIKLLSDSGFKHADPKLQADIDQSLTNWVNTI